ncbi:MAG: TIGR00645 family protein [Gammaproteobacteria bacterium]|nr:TIGR00645 family protein [Gammaproteobacteria bacterium]MCF6229629.1 TIGR00645 family protein [Gammaproteobacteria bacterium]
MKKFEHFLEMVIFNSRWLLVPYYLGLVFAIALLLVKFVKEFIGFATMVFTGTGTDVIIGILTLVDVVLLSNLLLIIVFAGYENFVSKIDTGDSEDRPSWMGSVSFSDLKMKLIGSIVAISGIELLKAFVAVGDGSLTNEDLAWKVGIHLVFVVTGLLFALSDWLTSNKKK